MLLWLMNIDFAGGATPAAATDASTGIQFLYYYPWIWDIYDDGTL